MTEQIRLEDDVGNTKATLDLAADPEVTVRETKGRKIDQLTAHVPKTETDNTNWSFDTTTDRVFLVIDNTDKFAGPLMDTTEFADTIEILANGPAQFADNRSQPTDYDNQYAAVADQTVINDAISDSTALTAGTIENIASSTWVFSSVYQLDKMHTVRETTGGWLTFNPDFTVDYESSIGSAKSTTLQPGSDNIVGTFDVEERSDSERVTHLLMLGAGEGEQQRYRTIVPSADTASYRNKATYSAANWSLGDPKFWHKYPIPDELDEDRLETVGKEIAKQREKTFKQVRLTTTLTDVDVGDTFPIKNDRYGIDETLEVIELTRRYGSDRLVDCVFSSRARIEEDEDEKLRNDTRRISEGVQGALNHWEINKTAPVDSSHDFVIDFEYPADVVFENRVELKIWGKAYRAGVGPGGHSHSVTVTHPTHSHSVDVTHPTHSHSVDVTHPQHSHSINVTHPTHSHDLTETLGSKNASRNQVYNDSGSTSISEFSNTTVDTAALPSGIKTPWIFHLVCGPASGETSQPSALIPTVESQLSGDVYNVDGGFTSTLESYAHVSGTVYTEENINSETFEFNIYQDGVSSLDVTWSWRILSFDRHTHVMPDSTEAALGTTSSETSSNALGTTTSETSNTALGTTSTETSNNALGTTTSETSDSVSDFVPGIQLYDGVDNSPAHYPENVDVLVNGNSQGKSFGNGTSEFFETVDLAGLLNSGQENTITLTSAGLGDLEIAIVADHYRQVIT